MITSVNEILYDDQAITATGSGDAISSVYTFTNLHQSMALSATPLCYCTLMVREAFNNITNLSVVLQNLIEGGSWATINNLRLTIALADLNGLVTTGDALFEGQIIAPVGDTGGANLTIGIRLLTTYVTSSGAPTTGKLWASFATGGGLGTSVDWSDAQGDTNVAALLNSDTGITR